MWMSICFHFKLENKGGKNMKDFSSIRSEVKQREETRRRKILLSNSQLARGKGWCLINLNIYIEKQINYIFHLADATKVNQYIKKIPLEEHTLHDKSIFNLDFFLILLSLSIAKKEYFNVTLTFIFLKMSEDFTNFSFNRKSQINNEWLIFLKY